MLPHNRLKRIVKQRDYCFSLKILLWFDTYTCYVWVIFYLLALEYLKEHASNERTYQRLELLFPRAK